MKRPINFVQYTKLLLILVLGFGLSGCASGARTGAMTTGVTPDSIIAPNAPVRNAIVVGDVTGGSETSPIWKSEVSTENFRAALEQSLQLNVMLALKTGRYRLDAELLDLEQPFAGFDMEVTAHIHYKITELASNRVVFDETIVTPHTTDMSDAFLGVERLRLANEGAVRDNIHTLIAKIIATPSLAKKLDQ
jgi:hypothetical protein